MLYHQIYIKYGFCPPSPILSPSQFSIGANFVPPPGHLAMDGDMFGNTWGREVGNDTDI